MVIIFKCSPEAKKALDWAMRLGEYADYSDVINAALLNFAVLSAELGACGSMVLHSPAPDDPREDRLAVPRMPTFVAVRDRAPDRSARDRAIPTIFLRSGIPDVPPCGFIDPPPTDFVTGQPVPLEAWVFGQYSKLLPVKASCRALANLTVAEGGGLQVERVAGQIAQEAAALGALLSGHDERHALIRDEALATGFPAADESGARSRLRYANQFVCAVSKLGQLSGLLADYRLINLTTSRTPSIQLTATGWAFARATNPFLDARQTAPSDRLSADERTILYGHIASSVPAEDFAFRTILAAIRDGVTTPDDLDAAVRKLSSKKALSDSFVTTQRSGLISRMADLGLVSRVRDGVRVSYAVTVEGDAYAARTAAA